MHLEDVPAGSVVVGVDGSDSSRRALLWAVDEARAEGRTLVVVHAPGWPAQVGSGAPTGLAGTTPAQQGQRILEEACAQARRGAPGLEVRDLLSVTDPRDLLIALSRRAAAVIVGSHAQGPVDRRLLGSVSAAVVRHSSCPVVVVPPGGPPPEHEGILVGVDVWDPSSGLLDFAYRQAAQRRLPLTLLHARARKRPGVDELQERQHLTDLVTQMREDHPDVVARGEWVSGVPGEQLAQKSIGMGLVVVGTPGGGPAVELLFGSIAAFVVDHAACPVAVVPIRDHV